MNNFTFSMPMLQAAASGQMVTTLVTFLLVILVFYFLIIRPQNKKQKETQKMIEAVKKGDKVVTIGGLHGTVHSVKDKTVLLSVDDNVKMELNKSAISVVNNKEKSDKSDKKA